MLSHLPVVSSFLIAVHLLLFEFVTIYLHILLLMTYGCFQLLAIMNKAGVNIPVYAFLWA